MKNVTTAKIQMCLGLLILAIMVLGSGCAARQVKIPRAKIQEKVETKFPLERSVIVAKTKLYSPKVYFEDGEVGIRMKFKATFLKKEVKGKVNVRGTVEYDADKYRFYIADMQIVDVETPNLKLSSFGELKSVVSKLVAKRLDGMVVYTLDTSKRRERYASKRIESVVFDEQNDIVIITLGKKQ
ncbi:MAG: DUF1439 domain-containing protein [Deltaproteobacteria bacterium]|nr:DUF1439 domain-containing protein [Deltaproteobacteria bacterium]